MGKAEDNPEHRSSGGGGSSAGSRSFLNCFLYVLCVSSLGFSVFTSFRQSQLEDRLKYMRHLDNRILILEEKLHASTDTSHSSGNSGNSASTDGVVQQLALQMVGLDRLKRDVSHLQIMRQERQASIQQSPDCGCPPGKPLYLYIR